MNDKAYWVEVVYMLVVFAVLFIFAFKEQPFLLAAAIAVLVIKQLGRINTTLKGLNNER